jgi:hypothetical protein
VTRVDAELIEIAPGDEAPTEDPEAVEVLDRDWVGLGCTKTPEDADAVLGALVGFVQKLVEVVVGEPRVALLDQITLDHGAEALIQRCVFLFE